MVFQNHARYPHLSVREHMACGLKIRRLSAADIEVRAIWWNRRAATRWSIVA